MIRVEGVSVYYGARKVVDQVSFEVASGETVAIVGRNGSGKSTLLKAIAGDVDIEGRVIVEKDCDLATISKRGRALKVAFVEQALPDVEMKVVDYVMLGRIPHSGLLGLGMEKEDREVAERVMAEVGVDVLAERNVNELSGGERQMCAIARVLAQETDVVLLDEPMASLDLANQMMVADLIEKMKGSGKTVLCVMHDMNMAMRYCDRVMVMKNGVVTALGKVGEEVSEEELGDAFGVRLEIIEVKDRNMRIIVPRK